MGRKTFESIGRALPGRETIVVTRDPAFAPFGVLVAHNVEAALELAAERARDMGADDIIIGGGGEIYAQTIARARRLFITEVALDAEGEARFPPINPQEWREISRETGERGARDDADFAFVSTSGGGDLPWRLARGLSHCAAQPRAAISREAEAREAEEHHRPGRGFGDRRAIQHPAGLAHRARFAVAAAPR